MNWYAGSRCKQCQDPISELAETWLCDDCLDTAHVGPEPVDHITHADTPQGNAEALLIYYINNVQVWGDLMHWNTDNHTKEFYNMQTTIMNRFGADFI